MKRPMIATLLAVLLASAACSADAELPSQVAAAPSAPVTQVSPSSSPDASPVPTEEAPAPTEEAPAPTEEPPAPTEKPQPAFARDTYIVTVSDGVRVRSKPGVGDDSRRLTPLLRTGAELFVVDGPRRASGFDWYQVAPIDSRYPFGWVAAGREGEPWLAESDFTCPDGPVDAAALAERREQRPFVNLACQGAREVAFKATMGSWEAQCGIDPCCTVEPCWLGDAFQDGWVSPPGSDPGYEEMVGFRFHPGIDREALPRYTFVKRLPVRITGQFDHPASARCHAAAGIPDPIPTPLAVLYCRSEFIVTGIRVLDR